MRFGKYIGYVLAIVLIVLLAWVIFSQVKEHMMQSDPMLPLLKNIILPLQDYIDKNYPEAKLNLRNMELYRSDSSYTLNKEKTFLCLYDDKGDYYPLHAILHVLLHEIAHSLNTRTVGHDEIFQKINQDIVDEATRLGIYNPSIPMIKGYCGVT